MGTFKDLLVYKKAFALSMEIFKLSKSFPSEEKYSLTDQIRRSSRSVCANLSEAYRKRQYKAHFLSKVSDADMEHSETQVWIDFALACNYISDDKGKELTGLNDEVGRLINSVLQNPEKYGC